MSGKLAPSDTDRQIKRKIKESIKLLDIIPLQTKASYKVPLFFL